MKRILAALLLCVSLCAAASAQTGYWTLLLDDQPVPAELPPVQVAPEVLLVAGRSLAHRMSAEFAYDATQGTITISNKSTRVDMKEGDTGASVNGKRFVMPAAPRREAGTMLVPVPFVPQALGATVTWNHNARMAIIVSSGHHAPGTAPPVAAPSVPTLATQPQEPAPAQTTTAPPPGGGTLVPAKSGIGQDGMPVGLAGPFSAPPVFATPPPGGGTQTAPSTTTPWGPSPTTPSLPNVTGVDMGVRTVAVSGSMDSADSLKVTPTTSTDDVTRPDPAITGILIERRFDSLFTTYSVRYRVTNLGAAALRRVALVRLLVGSDKFNGMQIVQDIKLDSLEPGQSLDFEWTGDARSHPCLYGLTVKAEAQVLLSEGAADGSSSNNKRSTKISH